MLRYLKALLFVGVPLTSLGTGIVAASVHAGGAYFWAGFIFVPGLWLAGYISDVDADTAGGLAIAVAAVVQILYWVGLIALFFKWQSWRAARRG